MKTAREAISIAWNAVGFMWDITMEVLFSKRNAGVSVRPPK